MHLKPSINHDPLVLSNLNLLNVRIRWLILNYCMN